MTPEEIIIKELHSIAEIEDLLWKTPKAEADVKWFIPGSHVQSRDAAKPGERYLMESIVTDGRCRMQWILDNQRHALEKVYHDITGAWATTTNSHGSYMEAVKEGAE